MPSELQPFFSRQKTESYSEIYALMFILATLAFIATGILAYLAVASSLVLTLTGVISAGLYLSATALVVISNLRETTLRVEVARMSPIGELRACTLNDICKNLYLKTMGKELKLTGNKTIDDKILEDFRSVVRSYNTPQEKQKFLSCFRENLSRYNVSVFSEPEVSKEKTYYSLAKLILEMIDPQDSIKGKKSLVPKIEEDVICKIIKKLDKKFKLQERNIKEISEFGKEIKSYIKKLSESHGNGLEPEKLIKEVSNRIDPNYVILPYKNLEHSLFLVKDLDDFQKKESAQIHDQVTEIYLDTLSYISGNNVKTPAPINPSLLDSQKSEQFMEEFAMGFSTFTLYWEPEHDPRYNQTSEKKERKKLKKEGLKKLEVETMRKLYNDQNIDNSGFIVNSHLIKYIYSKEPLDYKETITRICRLAIKGLEITEITDKFTLNQKLKQIKETELRLKILIREHTNRFGWKLKNFNNIVEKKEALPRESDSFKCMVWDCMSIIHPSHTDLFKDRLFSFERPADFPEIKDLPKTFEEPSTDILTEVKIIKTPSTAPGPTPLNQANSQERKTDFVVQAYNKAGDYVAKK